MESDTAASSGDFEMSEWIKCSERLPEIIRSPDGSVNCVLGLYPEDVIQCGFRVQVINTVWANKPLATITHWMPIPELPIE